MRRLVAIAAMALASTALAGCGSNSLSGDSKSSVNVDTSVDKDAQALVPDALKSKGTITVGTDASYAPSEILAGDGTTIEGFDIDLFNAVGQKLGLKVKFQNASFDTIIAGVTGGKYDVGVSSFTVNSERLNEVTMVSYFKAGTQWAVPSDSSKNVDPNKPCGLTVAVQKGTVQLEEDLPPKEKACKAEGNPINVLVYDKQDAATAAVVNGKADAMLADSPVVDYAVSQSNGKLQPAGGQYDSAPYGYVLPKDETDFGKAITMALADLQKDGDYNKILSHWGVDSGGIRNFEVNPSVS